MKSQIPFRTEKSSRLDKIESPERWGMVRIKAIDVKLISNLLI
jgi:hypothetical protein